MNRAFQVVIGVSIILLVIMLSIFFKGSGTTESQVAVVPPPTDKPAAAPEPKPKPKVHKVHIERHHEAQEADAELEKREMPLMTVYAAVPAPFPAAADVKAGMTREEMISKFGTPRVAASWAENGSLAEKFIYTRDAQVTAVMLLDGEVVRSRTGQSDPSVWPRRAGAKDKAGAAGAENADRDGAKAP